MVVSHAEACCHDKRAESRRHVLFVGAFQRPGDGTCGGQLFACQSLLNSEFSSHVRWTLLDTTQRSLPPPSLRVRGMDACARIGKAARTLCFGEISAGLVFSSFSFFSLSEKGLICWIGRLLGVPMTITLRSEVRPIRGFERLTRWFLYCVLSGSYSIVLQSRSAAERLAVFCPRLGGRSVVVHNWIRLPQYPLPRAGGSVCRQDKVRVVFMGWIDRKKGVFDLCEAVLRLKRQGLALSVLICGEGEHFTELESWIKANGLCADVALLGWVFGEEKSDVLASSDILILPSYSEGMPNAVLEAMSYGLPVVASRVGGIPELVKDGESGLLVDPGDVDALTMAIERLSVDTALRVRMGARARELCNLNHSVDVAWKSIAMAMGLQEILGDE